MPKWQLFMFFFLVRFESLCARKSRLRCIESNVKTWRIKVSWNNNKKKWQHQNVTCLTVKLFLRWKLIPESWYNVHKIPNDLIHKFVQPVNKEINVVAVVVVGIIIFCMWFFPHVQANIFGFCFHSLKCKCSSGYISVCHGMMFPATVFLEAWAHLARF